jgi:hypothetical protein
MAAPVCELEKQVAVDQQIHPAPILLMPSPNSLPNAGSIDAS